MLKEIAEQPRAIADTLLGRTDGQGKLVLDEVRLTDQDLRDIDKAKPFRLTRWSNGDLTLVDPQTGQSVELGSFGPTNRAAFEALL